MKRKTCVQTDRARNDILCEMQTISYDLFTMVFESHISVFKHDHDVFIISLTGSNVFII